MRVGRKQENVACESPKKKLTIGPPTLFFSSKAFENLTNESGERE